MIGLDHTWQLQHGQNIKQVDYVKGDRLCYLDDYFIMPFNPVTYRGGIVKHHETISGGLRNHPSALAVWS